MTVARIQRIDGTRHRRQSWGGDFELGVVGVLGSRERVWETLCPILPGKYVRKRRFRSLAYWTQEYNPEEGIYTKVSLTYALLCLTLRNSDYA